MADYQIEGQHVVDGMLLVKEIEKENVEKIRDFTSYVDGDVLISSYPKTGTTWMGEVLRFLLHDTDKTPEKHLSQEGLYMEMSLPIPPHKAGIDMLESVERPVIMKTHLTARYFEKAINESKLKVVLVMRNPKDTLVSYYHFYKKNALLGRFSGSFDEFFELHKAKKLFMCDYFDWYEGWLKLIDKPNVLLVSYEEMKVNIQAAALKLAKFLGKELDSKRMQALVQGSSVEGMKARLEREKVKTEKMLEAIPDEAVRNAKRTDMNEMIGGLVRKGTVGDWKNHFSEEQSKYVDDQYKERLESQGFHITFDIGPGLDHKLAGEHFHDGMVLGKEIAEESLEKIRNYTGFVDGDVLLSSYIKTGTTWMGEVLDLMLTNKAFQDDVLREDQTVYLEATFPVPPYKAGIEVIDQAKRPGFFKTHLPGRYFRNAVLEGKVKVVVVVRNPKDTLVSTYHFYKKNPLLGFFQGSFDDFFELFKAKKIIMGDFFDWYDDWLDLVDRPNVFLVSYEEMKMNIHEVIQRLAKFLGKEVSESKMSDVVESSSFGGMKTRLDRQKQKAEEMMKQVADDPEKVKGFSAMSQGLGALVRKGIVGDWKNYFSPAQSRFVEDLYKKRLESRGLKLHFELGTGVDHKIDGQYYQDGMLLVKQILPQNLERIRNFTDYVEGDVLISSYPKTGTTWMGGILGEILDKKLETDVPLDGQSVYLEMSLPMPPYMSGIETLDKVARPALLKSHLPGRYYEKAVLNSKVKVVVVIRNPKDTMVSYYHFYKKNPVLGHFTGSFDDFFELCKSKKLYLGDYFDWYEDWFKLADRSNVLIVSYEEMKMDIQGVIQKLSKFLGKDMTGEKMETIVGGTTLEGAKARIEQEDKKTEALMKEVSHDTEKVKNLGEMRQMMGALVRKGVVGDWKNHFSPEQSRLVDEEYKRRFESKGFKLLFELGQDIHKIEGEHMIDNMLMMKEVTKENVQNVKNYSDYVEGDVLLSTYPKTGTTWMAEILDSLLKYPKSDKDGTPSFQQSKFMEMSVPMPPFVAGIDQMDELKRPALLATHLPAPYFEKGINDGKLKVIITIRNPKDTLVSYYHFYKKVSMLGSFQGTFDEFFELYKARWLFCGHYFDWYETWLPYLDKPNVFLVSYEEMKEDIQGVIGRIGKFLGKKVTDEKMREVVDASTFDQVKKTSMKFEQKFVDAMAEKWKDDEDRDEKLAKQKSFSGSFARKGIIGDWKNHFTPEQSRIVDEEYRQRWESKGIFKLSFEPSEDTSSKELHKIDGEYFHGDVLLTKEISVDSLDKIKNYSSYVDGDVLLATYVKTGTTWMGEILKGLLTDEPPDYFNENLSDQKAEYLELKLPFPPFLAGIDQLDQLPERPAFVKSHLSAPFFEKGLRDGKLKVIITVRNPKDTLVSYYHFYKKSNFLGPFTGDFNAFFELYKAKKIFLGDYFDWYDTWLPHLDNPKVLLVSYEDMKMDIEAVVQKVAKFLGQTVTEDKLRAIVGRSTFDNMKKARKDLDMKAINAIARTMEGAAREKFLKDAEAFDSALTRKGVIGDWKNYFTPEQSRIVDDEYRQRMESKGFRLFFDSIVGEPASKSETTPL